MPRLPRLEIPANPTTIYEDAVLDQNAVLPEAFGEEDDDADYEVCLFWPSTSPYLLVPEESAHHDPYEVRGTLCSLCSRV